MKASSPARQTLAAPAKMRSASRVVFVFMPNIQQLEKRNGQVPKAANFFVAFTFRRLGLTKDKISDHEIHLGRK
jgi:hypothetical protein